MIRDSIVDIKDWPVEGVNFKDLSTVLTKPGDFRWALDRLRMFMAINEVDCIASPDARGFIWGAPVAAELELPFHMIRKPGKLPPPVISQSYDYEYDSGTLEIKGNTDIGEGTKVGIIDDVNATGGTALATIQLLSRIGVRPEDIFYASVIDLTYLNGSSKIRETGVTMIALVTYDSE
jgi:adenine phosphoribosyltransferase